MAAVPVKRFINTLLTFNNKICNFLISSKYTNCSTLIFPWVIVSWADYFKRPFVIFVASPLHFIKQTFHFCPGHRRLWVATGRAVKRSRLVLSHCLCVRWYNRCRKRNRFSRISLQSCHPSGPHCTWWGYRNIQLEELRYRTIWLLIVSSTRFDGLRCFLEMTRHY